MFGQLTLKVTFSSRIGIFESTKRATQKLDLDLDLVFLLRLLTTELDLDLDLYLGIQTAVMMILKAFQTQLTVSKPYAGQYDVVA